MLTFARTWTETNAWTQIRIHYPRDQVRFLSSKTFLLPPSVFTNPNSSSRKFTSGKTPILCERFSKFHWWNNSPRSQLTPTGLAEVIWKEALTETKQPPPNYYLHSGKHLYKLSMFCTQHRLEPDCKHLLLSQCTDPLAPWLHVFATPSAFHLTLKQEWVCKSAIHHTERALLASKLYGTGEGSKKHEKYLACGNTSALKLVMLNFKMLEKHLIAYSVN